MPDAIERGRLGLDKATLDGGSRLDPQPGSSKGRSSPPVAGPDIVPTHLILVIRPGAQHKGAHAIATRSRG